FTAPGLPIGFQWDAASGYGVSKASPTVVKTRRLPPSCVGSPATIAGSFASSMSAFFAGLLGLAFRRSFVPATGCPLPGGKEVVVTVLEVVTAVVVVVVQTPLLAGVGAARAKSALSLLVSFMRCRLMVPFPAGSADAA